MSLIISSRLMALPKVGKLWIVGACIAVATAVVWGLNMYGDIFHENVKKTGILYIPTGSDFQKALLLPSGMEK